MPDGPTTAARKKATIPVVVALVAAVIAAVVAFGPQPSADPPKAAQPPAEVSREGGRAPLDKNDPLLKVVRRDAGDPLAVGDVDAPVVLVEYSDFQCPFCGKFARDTEPELVKRFVDNGTLRIEWRDFPYLGSESLAAAHAGRAAAAQGKFWQFHEAMYADQQPPNSGKLDQDYLVSVADRIGLDVDRFRRDLYSGYVSEAVSKDFREGQSIGVTGTPAFLVNGQPIMGAQPTDVFVQSIEQAAANAR
ncbi:MAG TPA: thioredoxin domain-containing protein [Nocardioidaceae bacterium]|nr:thioredoxin domain-containing protein [Nocardioidaceae bacterium]